MKLRLIGHSSRYAIEQLSLILFPEEKPELTEEAFSGDGIVSTLSGGGMLDHGHGEDHIARCHVPWHGPMQSR